MKSIERKFAYAFCGLRILVDLGGIIAAAIFAVIYLQKNISIEVNVIVVLCMAVGLFIAGTDIHMIITRDIRHIMGKDKDKNSGVPEDN